MNNLFRPMISWFVLSLSGCGASPEIHIEREELIDEYLKEPRKVVVVDLDDTVVDGGWGSVVWLVCNLFYTSKKEFPGSAEALRELARDRDIVFLTARDDFFAKRSLRWLEARGFASAPVVFSTSVLPGESRKVKYKTAAVAELVGRGLMVDLGIGDKTTDMAAYLGNGLHAVLLVDGLEDPDLRGASEGDTAVWPRPFPMLSILDQVTFERETAWSEIAERWSGR